MIYLAIEAKLLLFEYYQKNMKKIAFLNNSTSWGGLEINIVHLAKWFKEDGNDVLLICLENSRAAQMAVKYDIPLLTMKQCVKKWSIREAYLLAKKMQKQGFSTILLSHAQDIYFSIYLKMFIRNSQVLYLQQMYVGVNKKDLLHTLFYKKLDAWISPLPYLKQNTLQQTRIAEDKIHVIPLCIETAKFIKPKNQSEIRQFLQLPLEKKIVGIIGRIDNGKGQEYVMEAIAQLRAKGYDLHALIMGNETKGEENTYLPYLKNLAEKLGITPYIHFRNHLEEVELAYGAIDYFVVASLEETYGMVTLEAMASKLPVVGVANYGTKELITPHKTGMYCKAKDAHSIAEALIYLLENPDRAAELALAAQQEVEQKYSHLIQVAAIKALCKEE
jgi:glycosyltransferase involved in cell wall biosynthesis